MKTIEEEEEEMGVRSLTCSILGVEGCWTSRMGTKTNDDQINYSHGCAQTK